MSAHLAPLAVWLMFCFIETVAIYIAMGNPDQKWLQFLMVVSLLIGASLAYIVAAGTGALARSRQRDLADERLAVIVQREFAPIQGVDGVFAVRRGKVTEVYVVQNPHARPSEPKEAIDAALGKVHADLQDQLMECYAVFPGKESYSLERVARSYRHPQWLFRRISA